MSAPVKGTDALITDHKMIRKVLSEMRREDPRFLKVVETGQRIIKAHAWFEDTLFLPAIEKSPLLARQFTDEIYQEHKDIEVLLGSLPWAQFTSFVAICLILIFFVTGWDSGTLVIDTMTAGGRTDTPLRQKSIWLFAVGGIGVVLLLSGGLTSLQAGAIATGLPLAVVLMLTCVGTLKGLLALHHARLQ